MDGDGVDTLSQEEQNFLTRAFSMDKLMEVDFGMESNKVVGPDGFNIEFYQHF